MIIKKKIGVRSRQLICGKEKNGPKLAFLKNMHLFVREFNEKTKEKDGEIVTARIVMYEDGTYSYSVKGIPNSVLIKRIAGEKKEITKEQLLCLTKEVLIHLNTDDVSKAYKMLLGTAKSSQIKVIE